MVLQLYENLLQELGITNYNILEIFETGSQLFKENPNDLDYIAVLETFENNYIRKHITVDNVDYDLVIMDYTHYKNMLTKPIQENQFWKLYRYMYLPYFKKIVYGGVDFTFDLLSQKEETIAFMKELYQNTVGKSLNKINFAKSFVHYYILFAIFDKNDVSLTEEEKQNVVKLYKKDQTIISLINELDNRLCKK